MSPGAGHRPQYSKYNSFFIIAFLFLICVSAFFNGFGGLGLQKFGGYGLAIRIQEDLGCTA